MPKGKRGDKEPEQLMWHHAEMQYVGLRSDGRRVVVPVEDMREAERKWGLRHDLYTVDWWKKSHTVGE